MLCLVIAGHLSKNKINVFGWQVKPSSPMKLTPFSTMRARLKLVAALSPTENTTRQQQAAGVGLAHACTPTAERAHTTWTRVYYATAQGHSASQAATVLANSCRCELSHWLPPSSAAQSACGDRKVSRRMRADHTSHAAAVVNFSMNKASLVIV